MICSTALESGFARAWITDAADVTAPLADQALSERLHLVISNITFLYGASAGSALNASAIGANFAVPSLPFAVSE